jgi:glutamate racemase
MTEREAPPIFTLGLFDSGVGGLSVAAAVRAREPDIGLRVVADQAHVPYGGRPLDEIRGFAAEQTDALFRHGADAVVMACNISSATAVDDARRRHGTDRVFGVIEDGARHALTRSSSGRIGVLATDGTVRAGAYTRILREHDPRVAVTEVACPAFVPLVEAGATETPEAEGAVRAALEPIHRAGCDVVILGCTHYPMLLPALGRAAPELRFVDPALAVATRLAPRLRPGTDLAFWTTGTPHHFRAQLRRWLPDLGSPPVGGARWTENRLVVDPARPVEEGEPRA